MASITAMSSLRDQLKEILPKILPRESTNAIKGTELIRLVKFQLKQEYSDATLRYHFSILTADPSAPIAKVAQGQGYFLRPNTQQSLESVPSLIGLRQASLNEQLRAPEEIDRDIIHLAKFRAIVDRWLQSNQRYPFFFDHAYATDAPACNSWLYPEIVAADWMVASATDEGIKLDPRLIARHRMLGAPMFSLTGMKLRLDVALDSFREDLFQSLSQSDWTNAADFLVASPIDDASLSDDLAALGQAHGVGVVSFGLTPTTLDELPSPERISSMQPLEFDAVTARMRINRLSMPVARPSINWSRVSRGDYASPDIDELFSWLEHCISAEIPISSQDFLNKNRESAME
ncbi:hypothetical protein [Sulfuriroseicoccus oceanibius]|uniref:Uncharacterized protein n=1 Tax=Sulfuriroseicoccus oceanibius TaxID=2707525 RepID=A0A6B3L6W9_9BACT|nr:hypothetical protein [Sulfuriroseicoccus oceanibius]QQL43808.1 hypothetical protein G3M56_007845 [Sulfuriroseicoccus oceanibius]